MYFYIFVCWFSFRKRNYSILSVRVKTLLQFIINLLKYHCIVLRLTTTISPLNIHARLI